MSARRILITGVGGFVGGHLAPLLSERGEVVLGLGLEPTPPSTARFLEAQWHADLLDRGALDQALSQARPWGIVHLAGQSSAGLSFEQPLETYRVNALGTYTLLEAVRSACPEARVLVVGTGEVYGPQPEGSRVAEATPLAPSSPYALSKAAAETIALALARLHRLDVQCSRSFGQVGPGQIDRFVVPSFARQIARIESGAAEPVVRVGNLEVTRDLSDVRDVAAAYHALLTRGVSGTVYNVCRGTGVRLTAVLDHLCSRARVPVRIEADPARMRPSDVPYLVGDPAAIEKAVDWRATTPLESTLDEVLAEWRARS